MNRTRRVETVPGRWHRYHQPALYGSRAKTVMVRPARTVYEHVLSVARDVSPVCSS
jgi:hypothetical protein